MSDEGAQSDPEEARLDFQTSDAAKDYFAGVSKSIQDDLKREVLMD
jgi:hypothetical protein